MLLFLAACGSSGPPRTEAPPQPGTAQTCADICRQSSPTTDDYTKCVVGCPGPEAIGEPNAADAGVE
jgi:hypothetical protein